MKKLLLSMVFIGFFVATIGQALAISLSLVPSDTTINPGDPLTVDVNIGGLGNFGPDSLGAFFVEVTFDPNVLTFTSEAYGSLLGDTDPFAFETDIITTVSPGLVSLDEVSFLFDFELDALQPDSFTLATLSFSGNNLGSTELGFGLVDLSNAAFPANTLDVDTFNTTAVSTNPIPEPSTLLLLSSGLVGLVFWRWRTLQRTT